MILPPATLVSQLQLQLLQWIHCVGLIDDRPLPV